MISRSKQSLIASLLLLLLTTSLASHFWRWNFDDGEIVYRVVRNLLTFGEWSYNRGEAFNPSTSALNTILIALVSLCGVSIPDAGHVVGSASLFAVGLGLFFSLKLFWSPSSALLLSAGSLWLLGHSSVWGLETYLFLALLSWLTPLKEKKVAPWILLGLLPLARPDGLVVVGTYAIWHTATKKELPWLGGVIVTLILSPWIFFSLYTFGQPFPDTLSVKMWQGRSGLWGQGRVYLKGLLQHLSSPLELLASAAAILSLLIVRNTFRALAFLIVFVAAQQAAYIFLNVPFYHWYVVAFDLARWCLAGLGAVSVISMIAAKSSLANRAPKLEYFHLAAVAMIVVLMSASVLMRSPAVDPRDEGYRLATEVIKQIAPAANQVAAVEVGTIGYELDTKILDLAGLASKNPELVSGQHTDYFFQQLPEIVILHAPLWHFESAIFDDVRFEATYEEAARTSHFAFPMVIYRKKTGIDSVGSNLASYVDSAFPKVAPLSLESPPTSDSKTACIFDRVNGKATQPGMVLPAKPLLLAISGWSALLDQSEMLGEIEIVLRETSTGNTYSLVQKERLPREDVAKHLGVTGQNNSGFSIKGSITTVPSGDYSVVTRQKDSKGNLRWCGPVITLQVRGE